MAGNKNQVQAYTDIYVKLSRLYRPEANLKVRASLVSPVERGKQYHLDIKDGKPSCMFQVDGYIIKTGQKCDHLALVQDKSEDWTEIFIELKGTDTRHAIVQLRESLKQPIFRHGSVKTKLARIVATSFPSNRSDVEMEKAKIEFLKSFHCELRGMKNGQKDKI